MKRVGLTGGIGAGKSTVAGLMADRGAVVIDADALAREAVAPLTPGLTAVLAEFGSALQAPDGSLDRAALAAVVFADPDALARLNAIVHPLVAARSAELLAAAPSDAVVVYDVPLLVENQLQGGFDVVVVVDADDDVRLQRLVDRGLPSADAVARMAAQANRAERLAVADYVITNNSDLAGLAAQVADVWQALVAV